MGDNSKTDNKVVEGRFAITLQDYEDVFIFLPAGKGEIFGVKISVEVCCEDSDQDRRCDMLIDLAEALTKTMVGMYGFTQKAHIQEHKGSLRLANREDVVQS